MDEYLRLCKNTYELDEDFECIGALDKFEGIKLYMNKFITLKIPELSEEILQHRVDKCYRYHSGAAYDIPVKHNAYMWYDIDELEKIFDCDSVEFLGYYPTIHNFGYQLLFKPDMYEVVKCLPDDIFDHDNILLSTNYAFENAYENTIGDYHLGITSVYTCENPKKTKKRVVNNFESQNNE